MSSRCGVIESYLYTVRILICLLAAIPLMVGGGVVFGADTTPQFSREQIEFYEKQVRPILTENCYRCHSHEADKIKGSFVLDSREGLLKGGETGPAVVPGEPEKSLLIKAVRQVDEDLKMPPKKKLSDEQIAILERWIKLGAPYSAASLIASEQPRSKKITAEDRKWWSFQPVRAVAVPDVNDGGWVRNPIDKFIFAKLNAAGLRPAREAERRSLIRRAYFDVIGLPPSATEVERFVSDKSPQAYEKVIDSLLSNPNYGEKWARHWLDLVRYGESDGYKADTYRPNAWRYRDYVIRSFNEDKPYDRFLMEQIAADELWPDDPNALIGLSYLRLWIYEYNQRDVRGHWATILNDITDVTGDAFMGLGMQCARCHDHKFDPILQRDYYRLQAFFAALSPRDDFPLASAQERKAYAEKLAAWEAKTASVRARIEELERPARQQMAKAVNDKFSKDLQALIFKRASERTPYEQQIVDLANRQQVDEAEKLDGKFHGEEKQKRDELYRELEKYDDMKPPDLPAAMLVTDIGSVAPPVTIPKDKSQTAIEPGFLTLLEEAPAKIEPVGCAPNSTGRRAALAKWFARADNPFTPRVMVNRVWQHHFGSGLVATPNDFGHLGEQPSHPELLDWLAKYFIEHNWSIKAVQKLILTSATYRQSAVALAPPGPRDLTAKNPRTVDPQNRLLWRQNVRRLEGDQIRDAMLSASGELDLSAGGQSVDASKPRRTIYTKWLRNTRDPLLEVFDPADPYTSTPQRNVTTTPMQSLVMINGPYVLQRAQALAKRVAMLNLKKPEDRVEAAYRMAFARGPTETERRSGSSFLDQQARRLRGTGEEKLAQVDVEPMPGSSSKAALFKPDGRQARLQVPDNHLMPQYDFTIEASMLLRSADGSGALRTIVSRWDGKRDQPGWSFGVGKSGNSSAQNLVLELVGDTSEDGTGGYELISSGLKLELDKPYYVAASVRIGDASESGVTFFLKELKAGADVRTAHVAHKVTANHQSNLPLVLGARDSRVAWDGLIDDVRLSNKALKAEELLLTHDGSSESTVGYWRFEEPDALKDSSPHGHNIRPEVSPSAQSDPEMAALLDFCHVLLNSNEFLYLD